MPYRDVIEHNFRARPSPIYAPFLPSIAPVVAVPSEITPKQLGALRKLEAALRRVIDPGGEKKPLSLRLFLVQRSYWVEACVPSPLPEAPPSFSVRLSESFELIGHEVVLVGARLRNAWADYFCGLERERLRHRQEALTKDEHAQHLLSQGLCVACPRCGETTYQRVKREALRLRDLPVPLLRTRETCSTCNLSRLIDEIRCAKCQGNLVPTSRSQQSPDSSDPALPIRDILRWRCEGCHTELVSTNLRYTEPHE